MEAGGADPGESVSRGSDEGGLGEVGGMLCRRAFFFLHKEKKIMRVSFFVWGRV